MRSGRHWPCHEPRGSRYRWLPEQVLVGYTEITPPRQSSPLCALGETPDTLETSASCNLPVSGLAGRVPERHSGGELGGQLAHRGHAPAAGSAAASSRWTNADPTMTPSAKPATSAACAPSRTPSPTATGRLVTSRIRRDQPGGGRAHRVAGAGGAHQRGRVDEPAAGRGDQRDPLVRRTRRDQEDPVQPARVRGRQPVPGLLRRQVRGDQPGRRRPRPGRGRTRPRRSGRPGSSTS